MILKQVLAHKRIKLGWLNSNFIFSISFKALKLQFGNNEFAFENKLFLRSR